MLGMDMGQHALTKWTFILVSRLKKPLIYQDTSHCCNSKSTTNSCAVKNKTLWKSRKHSSPNLACIDCCVCDVATKHYVQ